MTPKCNRLALVLGLLAAAAATPASADAVFTLSSPNFTDGATLDKMYVGNNKAQATCTGENTSPALDWSAPPAATKSFAFMIYDQQGRLGLGVVHQVAYGIPAATKGFKLHELETGTGFVHGIGTNRNEVYYGPCPTFGSGPHHYVFTLIATDLDPAALPPGLTRDQLLEKLDGHALLSTSIVGKFGQ